jgi:hypothetical protein
MITRLPYGGWANNVQLSNGLIELVATLDVGPRLIRFGFAGGPNVFKEFAGEMGGTGESEWKNRGGHRLWHAPEAKPRTYALDNFPVAVEELSELAIRLTPPVERENGIQAEIEVLMDPTEARVTVIHRLTNVGRWEIELAPWALTVMDAGGMSVVPLPPKQPHTDVLTPGFPLVLWPYTDMADTRFRWGTQYITFRQDAAKGPGKFGLPLEAGWAAYRVHDTLFVKYFDYDPTAEYPDLGCNYETFSNEEMLEVESLGPLTLLEPGEAVEHVETWRLFNNVPAFGDDASIDKIVLPRVES